MIHRYSVKHDADGDYIALESLCWNGTRGSWWQEHTRWLIPGTQLED